jgi:hypothetical protein
MARSLSYARCSSKDGLPSSYSCCLCLNNRSHLVNLARTFIAIIATGPPCPRLRDEPSTPAVSKPVLFCITESNGETLPYSARCVRLADSTHSR